MSDSVVPDLVFLTSACASSCTSSMNSNLHLAQGWRWGAVSQMYWVVHEQVDMGGWLSSSLFSFASGSALLWTWAWRSWVMPMMNRNIMLRTRVRPS